MAWNNDAFYSSADTFNTAPALPLPPPIKCQNRHIHGHNSWRHERAHYKARICFDRGVHLLCVASEQLQQSVSPLNRLNPIITYKVIILSICWRHILWRFSCIAFATLNVERSIKMTGLTTPHFPVPIVYAQTASNQTHLIKKTKQRKKRTMAKPIKCEWTTVWLSGWGESKV